MAEITRSLATAERIVAINPIPGADAIEAVTVRGWQVVAKKNEFVVGDLVVYFEIDSFVPSYIAPFLTKSGHFPKEYEGIAGERLRTVKLRGQVSQGLVLHFGSIKTADGDFFPWLNEHKVEGANLTEVLGVLKYEPPVPACLAGLARGTFPSWGRKTDQERIENIVRKVFEENKDSEYEVTLKMDGSSTSVYYREGEIGVCSRNMNLKIEENTDNSFISIAKSTGLLGALEQYKKNIMVQGELMGPGIQGNKEKLTKFELFVFDIFNIDTQEYYGTDERLAIIDDLRALGFTGKHVPIIARDATLQSLGITDVASSKVFVDRPSLNNPIAEGCVFKRKDGKFSFKSINNKFLLKFE